MLSSRMIPIRQMTPHMREAWRGMVRTNPHLSSPFFHPTFSELVATGRDDVHLLLIESADNLQAILPLQGGVQDPCVPVGGSLNDFQGLIAHPDFHAPIEPLMRSTGMRNFTGAKLLNWQEGFGDLKVNVEPSPLIDLSGGFSAWSDALAARGSNQLRQAARKRRKIEREVGPLHFVAHTTDRSVKDQLIRWKQDQYRRTGETDVFANDSNRKLLEALLSLPNTDGIQPMLSALYAGDQLIAAHFGLTTSQVTHWWFPAYDLAYAKYSPGKLMLVELLKETADRGVERFDFGRGAEEYKSQFATDSVPVVRVAYDAVPIRRSLHVGWYHTRQLLKSSSFGDSLRRVRRLLKTGWSHLGMPEASGGR